MAEDPKAPDPSAEGLGGEAEGLDAIASHGDIEELCNLLELSSGSRHQQPGGSRLGAASFEDAAQDVEELLGALGPHATPSLHARLSPMMCPVIASPAGAGSLSRLSPSGLDIIDDELPEAPGPMPPSVWIRSVCQIANFNLRCEIDLKKVAFGLRHAEFNPRKHGSLTLRLLDPKVTALIRQSGAVTVSGSLNLDELKLGAKKVARLVQKAAHPEAKFKGYEVSTQNFQATFDFPIRLDEFARKWRRHACYEPELYCGCVFRTTRPKAAYLLTAGGAVSVSGLRTKGEAVRCLTRLYHVLKKDFST